MAPTSVQAPGGCAPAFINDLPAIAGRSARNREKR